MTQTLVLETAWEKQVSLQDRQLIEHYFQQEAYTTGKGISYTYLRHDFNHQQALLVMVLIHNYDAEPVVISDRLLSCYDREGNILAEGAFSLPVPLSAQTSMPWTFIFPQDTYTNIDKETMLMMHEVNMDRNKKTNHY